MGGTVEAAVGGIRLGGKAVSDYRQARQIIVAKHELRVDEQISSPEVTSSPRGPPSPTGQELYREQKKIEAEESSEPKI